MRTESNEIIIADTMVNLGFSRAPVVNLYHINFGYPFIDEGARMYFSADNSVARDDIAKKSYSKYNVVEKAEIGRPEECYIHTVSGAGGKQVGAKGGDGGQFGMIHNSALGIAVVVHYDEVELPIFCEWKCMLAGDYAVGLEPSVAGFWGIRHAVEEKLARYLEPGESESFHLRIEILDDPDAIGKYASMCKENNM